MSFPKFQTLTLVTIPTEYIVVFVHMVLFFIGPCSNFRNKCNIASIQEYTEHERRQLLIARLPNIHTLNGGGAITHEEREDAERAFIRYYMDKPESDRPERYV